MQCVFRPTIPTHPLHSSGGISSNDGQGATMRLALISTPRSGNTWLNAMLTMMFRLARVERHTPDDVSWDRLPPRMLLQLHWHRVEPLVSLLRQHQLRVVTVVRHPFDVLLSILNFCSKEPKTRRWLDGHGGDEQAICGRSPGSEAFLKYATGARARALLSVSRQWWTAPGVCRVRYEQLVSRTASELARIAEELGEYPAAAIQDVIDAAAMTHTRQLSPVHLVHMWQGQPGHWRSFLTAPVARRIYAAHPDLFETFEDYSCDPDETLTAEQAEVNWYRLQAETRAREFDAVAKQLQETTGRYADELERVRGELERYADLDPVSIALSRRIRRIATRLPGARRLLKWILRPVRDAA